MLVYDKELGEKVCNHEEAYLEPPCCSGRDSEGNPSCACHGVYGVLCPAPDCTGIKEWEVERLFDMLMPDEEDYYED